ncbi:hypothetical protein [Williamsia soli]|uniref:hypothetical protein n=1 Tax=Williamsia soli TaxID=364929 RepID=UPI001A9DC96C|nr:hypothetical protein [Williamsia soli]
MIRHNVRTECWGFAVGSSLFALGSAPGFAHWAGAPAANISFFVGSWFFTFAAFVQLQLCGSLHGPTTSIAGSVRVGREVHRSEWWSAMVQFAGTIAFNISTGAVFIVHSVVDADRFSWRPDVYGSAAFLISSGLAVFATELYRRRDEPDAPGWTATVLNTAGSIAFGFSAVAAYIDPETGKLVAPFVDQAGTFIGALCFLAASLISLPRESVRALAS